MTRQFHKLLALYSASTLRSDSMLAIGLIQREGLMHYAQAVVALYANAVICEDNLKEYGRAIKLYQELINRFSRHELSTDAKRRSSALEQKR